MKEKTILFIMLAFLLLAATGCEKENSENADMLPMKTIPCGCDDRDYIVITILKNEPAVVTYSWLLQSAVLELENKEKAMLPLLPCEDGIPSKLRFEGMRVLISGEIFGCGTFANEKGLPRYKIKLSDIFIPRTCGSVPPPLFNVSGR